MTFSAEAGSFAIARVSPRCLSAWMRSAWEPTVSTACRAGTAMCFAKPTRISIDSMRPAKSRSASARERRSKIVFPPPIFSSAAAASLRSVASGERRCSTSPACSVGLFTLGRRAASVERTTGSAAFSALTNGVKRLLSGAFSTRRAKTASRCLWRSASGALPVTTSSSLSRSAGAGDSAAATNASTSSGDLKAAALNWFCNSLPADIAQDLTTAQACRAGAGRRSAGGQGALQVPGDCVPVQAPACRHRADGRVSH